MGELEALIKGEQNFIIPKNPIGAIMEVEGIVYCLCPVTGEVDRFQLNFELTPGIEHRYPEFVKFEQFLEGLKDAVLGLEDTIGVIYNYLLDCCSPSRLFITLESTHEGKYLHPKMKRLYEEKQANRNY